MAEGPPMSRDRILWHFKVGKDDQPDTWIQQGFVATGKQQELPENFQVLNAEEYNEVSLFWDGNLKTSCVTSHGLFVNS